MLCQYALRIFGVNHKTKWYNNAPKKEFGQKCAGVREEIKCFAQTRHIPDRELILRAA